MSSTSMLPPPSPVTARKTPLSPPVTPQPCISRNMSPPKAATFHVPSSPPSEEDPRLTIAFLPRRSPTSSRSSLSELLCEKTEDAARYIQDFEQTFSGARGKARRRSHRQSSSSSDEGLGSSICGSMTKTFQRALDLDSAIGSSIKSETKDFEDDGPVVDLIQENQTPSQSALVQSITPLVQSASYQPALNRRARQTLTDLVLDPLLQEQRFKSFHPVVATVSQTKKTIRCLRDLEQFLIFKSREIAVSRTEYRSFGDFTVQLVLDTYPHLSENEQRRPADRPYDNGYFLDLVQQVGRLAAQVGAARMRRTRNTDAMEYDEVTLEGGMSETGHPAELVRWKDGKGTSLRNNEPYEAQPAIKRQHSSESLDGDAERSMARRKKNAEAKITEMRCSDRSCDKIFNRKCDLAKHEKTHSRPFKCPEKTCRYHTQGLPTEKERERHFNDKHAADPAYFHCTFCPFKTKRDSNCKQHMEKKHGWVYERSKISKTKTPLQTPQTPSLSTPAASDDWTSGYGSESGGNFTPHSASVDDFGESSHVPHNPYTMPLFPPNPIDHRIGYASPEVGLGQSPYEDTMTFSPHGPHMNSPFVTEPTFYNPPLTPAASLGQPVTPGYLAYGNPTFTDDTVPAGSRWLRPHSRNPSISGVSPMITDNDFLRSGESAQADAPAGDYTGLMDLPMDDFSLFGGSAYPAAMHPAFDMTSPSQEMSDAAQGDVKYNWE